LFFAQALNSAELFFAQALNSAELFFAQALNGSLTRFPGQWLYGTDCVVVTGGIASRGVDVVSDLENFAAHVADLRY